MEESELLSGQIRASPHGGGVDSSDRWSSVFRRPSRSPGRVAGELRTPSAPLYAELRASLRDPEWARRFVERENGVETLLETLQSLRARSGEETGLRVECGRCLRLVMDTRVGLDYVMENVDYTQKLVAALDTDDIPVKKQVFELLSALCVYRTDGYVRALETLEHYKSAKKRRYRFQLVVEELRGSEAVEYATALVAFVNCLIISPASLGERVRIRNEFLGLKILEVLNRFRQQCKDGQHSDLAVQLDVFDEQRSTDEGQFAGPDGVDLSSHMDVFFAILRQVAETPQEIPFLSILQHLLRTDLQQPLSELIFETAETLVHRATLLESRQEADRLLRASNLGGLRCHCSCHYRQNSDDCETTPGKKSRPNQLAFCPSEGARTPTALLSPSQPLTPCDFSSSPLPCSKPSWKGPHQRHPEAQEATPNRDTVGETVHQTEEDHDLTSSPLPSCHTSKLPWKSPPQRPVQEVPSRKDTTVSENVPQTVKASTQCDDALSNGLCSSSSNTPSVISQDSSSSVLPKVPNVPPPPPPPPPFGIGCPPPPPPPPLAALRLPSQAKQAAADLTLPQTDTPKPKAKMKSFNWTKIPVSKVIGRDNLWSRIAKDHTGSPNDLDFDAMEVLFCQQPVSTGGHVSPRFGDPSEASDKKRREIQEINLLDGKRSLNINIFLKQFRSSNESIARILEEGAHQDLGAERLRGLLKILPEADEVDLLKNFDGDKTKLGSAEKFLLQLIEVPSYKLRVESMLLKEEFLANQEFLESSIETIRCAAQELEECRKLHEVLYRVLVAGNFLNAGGYAGNAAGFKMLSLLKLTDIRANKPSVTLVHYVAEEVLKKRPDLLDFPDEIQNLEEASKISMETLKTDVSSLCQRVSRVSTQVIGADDQIRAQMQDFVEFAQSTVEALQNEMNELEGVRQRLADFLCEDAAAFKLEDCFRVFRSFATRFKAALQENERRQKQEQLAEARRKQREQQMALKRRSLELPDARSSTDHIMDELLGDIRSGFPERRLGRRDPDDRLKRHSDPAMLEKCLDLDTFRSRRARFADGFPQAGTADGDTKDRRSFGSIEDSLERVPLRRSGRRKRVGVEVTGPDAQSRERSGTSPPPQVALPAVESQEPELDSKQRLRSKINDWLLQNEKEQKRERDLQIKLLQERKKRLSSGQLTNGDVENHIPEEVEEGDSKQVAVKQQKNCNRDLLRDESLLGESDDFKMTKSASSRRSESFTQKIIGLIDASSNGSRPFAKTRLYSSTRESGGVRVEPENKSKDDSQVCTQYGRQASSSEDTTLDGSKKPEGGFDRFAPTRKTQRRLKLREMRIEAENIKTVRPEDKKSPDPEVSSPDSSVRTDGSSLIRNETGEEVDGGDSVSDVAAGKCVATPERKDSSANPTEADGKCDSGQTREPSETKELSANGAETTHAFSRQKNTSLRSRQSRLARRINSLTTPVTSPDSAGSSAVVSESDEHTTKPEDSEPKEAPVGEPENDPKQPEKSPGGPVPETTRRPNQAENKVPRSTTNGHLSHKVTVSTETKSKVVISKTAQNPQTSAAPSSKSRVPLQKAATNIPGVVKTTRNVRVQQTTKRETPTVSRTAVTQKAEVSRRVESRPPTQSKGNASKGPAKAPSSIKQPRVNSNLTNGSQNGSLSSLCNVNTNVRLVKNEKTERTGANKITIQHNGSVKFMKNNISASKPASNTNSTPKIEKNVPPRRRAFV